MKIQELEWKRQYNEERITAIAGIIRYELDRALRNNPTCEWPLSVTFNRLTRKLAKELDVSEATFVDLVKNGGE